MSVYIRGVLDPFHETGFDMRVEGGKQMEKARYKEESPA
jgi:hypothetical protein